VVADAFSRILSCPPFPVLQLRCDNGNEFLIRDLLWFLAKVGAQPDLAQPVMHLADAHFLKPHLAAASRASLRVVGRASALMVISGEAVSVAASAGPARSAIVLKRPTYP